MSKHIPFSTEQITHYIESFASPKHWSFESAQFAFNEVRDGTHDSPKKVDSGIPLVTSKNLKNGKIDLDNTSLISKKDHLEISKRSMVKLGDILFSMIGTIGNTCLIIKEPNFSIKNVALYRNNPQRVLPRFGYYWLKSDTYQKFLEKKQRGGNQKFLSLGVLRDSPVILPPISEQKRIADKLDRVLEKVEAAQARLDKIPFILKRFRQSVLTAATSGELTKQWRENNPNTEPACNLLKRWLTSREISFNNCQELLIKKGNIKRAKKYKPPIPPDTETSKQDLFTNIPSTWRTVSVSEFANCLDSFRVPVKKDERQSSQGLYPYFGANGVVDRVDEFIFDDDIVMVTEDETFYGREKPIAFQYSGKCWVNNHAHVLKAETSIANTYLCYALMYYHVIPWLTGTTGRAKLTQAALNKLPICLPPEAEMAVIVKKIDELFDHSVSVEKQYRAATARLNKLTQSILASAFRGELNLSTNATE